MSEKRETANNSSAEAIHGKKLLYIFDHLDWKSRMPVALAAKNAGYNVTIGIVGAGDDAFDRDEKNADHVGFAFLNLPKPKHKFGPFSVISSILAMRQAVHANAPDLLHTVTLKYSFLVGLACWGMGGFRILYTIAGLGFLFRSEGMKPVLLRCALSPLLKMVLKRRDVDLIFQNKDDRDLLIDMGYARPDQAHLIIGSGVDLARFKAMDEPQTEMPIALMPTRLVHEKGVAIFVEAARLLQKKGVKARYQIAGGLTSHNPRALSAADMARLTDDGVVEWLGRVEDMPRILSEASVVVYPSYYGEGVPRVAIEACAAGRPVITTDHPGCRETVPEGKNGILVPVKDVRATADAMEKLLSSPELRAKMGLESRKLAQRVFDVKAIAAQTLALYQAQQ